MRPSNQGDLRAVGGKKNAGIGQSRRALSAINDNIHGAQPFPSLVHKRGALTEKFNAQNAAKKPHQQQLVQDAKPSVVSANASDGYIIINVEDDDDNYKTNGDYPIPMSVQHTEAFLHEIDRLVEMEDVAEEPVLDIDQCDKEDPLAVVEYIDDIYAYYKRTEMSSYAHPDYMRHQSDKNEKMRVIVIDWRIEVISNAMREMSLGSLHHLRCH